MVDIKELRIGDILYHIVDYRVLKGKVIRIEITQHTDDPVDKNGEPKFEKFWSQNVKVYNVGRGDWNDVYPPRAYSTYEEADKVASNKLKHDRISLSKLEDVEISFKEEIYKDVMNDIISFKAGVNSSIIKGDITEMSLSIPVEDMDKFKSSTKATIIESRHEPTKNTPC
jgi:hypothetical protein